MALVNSYTNWGKLKEVWLGDVYPSHFYDHLESQVCDVFYELTERTQQDLDMFKNTEFAQYCKQWQERQNKNLDFGY